VKPQGNTGGDEAERSADIRESAVNDCILDIAAEQVDLQENDAGRRILGPRFDENDGDGHERGLICNFENLGSAQQDTGRKQG
jgi:hypothetical protein